MVNIDSLASDKVKEGWDRSLIGELTPRRRLQNAMPLRYSTIVSLQHTREQLSLKTPVQEGLGGAGNKTTYYDITVYWKL